ncbi:MAG: hypothetical protein ACI4V3_09585, partial [Faecousia sp.]
MPPVPFFLSIFCPRFALSSRLTHRLSLSFAKSTRSHGHQKEVLQLPQRNRAEQEKRRKIERKKLMVKCTANATIFVVCGAVASVGLDKYKAVKEREAILAAEEAKRFEEAARRET